MVHQKRPYFKPSKVKSKVNVIGYLEILRYERPSWISVFEDRISILTTKDDKYISFIIKLNLNMNSSINYKKARSRLRFSYNYNSSEACATLYDYGHTYSCILWYFACMKLLEAFRGARKQMSPDIY